MAFRLSKKSLQIALKHISRYGDTDVFPHLPEIMFFRAESAEICTLLAKLDLDTFLPSGAFEAIAPKSRYGFRVAHQLPGLETLLLLACVVEIGKKIEEKRIAHNKFAVRSYRFFAPNTDGQIFRADRTYKDWLLKQMDIVHNDKSVIKVVSTDISDFYSRINFHRLENLLDQAAEGHGAVRFIKKQLKAIRAKQSFGLPVGGSAARLLAELALCDTDIALRDADVRYTRFVDDFRILLSKGENPYDALGVLAEQLGINEGLSLNVAKTIVQGRSHYLAKLNLQTADVSEDAEGVALDVITANLYFGDEPDEELLEKLKGINLIQMLDKEVSTVNWEAGKVRVLFRALRLATPYEAISYIVKNFDKMTIFSKEMCLLMEVMNQKHPGCFNNLRKKIITSIAKPPASSLEGIRCWLLEVFVRGIVNINVSDLANLKSLHGPIDKRQMLLIRGRAKDINFFRKQKTALTSYSDADLLYLVWGATCLPKDEYKNWIDTVRPRFEKTPLGLIFLKWISANRSQAISKIGLLGQDHLE